MTENGRPLGIGVIGCGVVTEKWHLPALASLPVRVVAAVDVHATQLERVANRFKIAQRLTDYRALLALPEIDLVAILAPTVYHAEMGLAALDAGKHCLIEKPLATTIAECEQLMTRAARSDRRVLMGYNMRWHRLVRQARERIASGALGRIHAINSVYTHARPPVEPRAWLRWRRSGGGAVFNEGVHHFDLWRFLLQTEVAQVTAITQPSAQYEDDTTVLTARMQNGTLASGVFAMQTSSHNQLEIIGERGRLVISLYRFDGLEQFEYAAYPGDLSDRARKIAATMWAMPQWLPVVTRGGDTLATYRAEWMHLLDCIQNDTPLECTLQDGLRALQVAEAVVQAATSEQTVRVG